MNITLVTALGERHGLIETRVNACPPDDFKHMSPANKAKMEKEKKEDSRLVKAEYINRNGKMERLNKPYCRYAGDPIQMWSFIPGYVYEVPMGLIKEVNGVKVQKRAGLVSQDDKNVNPDGSPLEKDTDAEWVHKFVPCSF